MAKSRKNSLALPGYERQNSIQRSIIKDIKFGDLVNFNPHIHVLAADGAFDPEGGFTVLPPIPRKVLEPWFRKEALALLRREGLVAESLAEKMLAWRHTGFSAHNAVRVGARDSSARRRLAQIHAEGAVLAGKDVLRPGFRHGHLPLTDAQDPQAQLPNHVRHRLVGAALRSCPGSFRAPGAVCRLVCEP